MSKYDIHIKNNRISNTWWGQAWTKNINLYSDICNRLERGRTYVRKNAIKEIEIIDNNVYAKVKGSDSTPYNIQIKIEKLPKDKYDLMYNKLTAKIENVNQLCSGTFPNELKEIFSSEKEGIFPNINEISFGCSCPDVAIMCKHIAAVLYGIGNILDTNPLLIFQLRGINLEEFLDNVLIEKSEYYLEKASNLTDNKKIIDDNIEEMSDLFGIELSDTIDNKLNEESQKDNKEKHDESKEYKDDTVVLHKPLEVNIREEIVKKYNLLTKDNNKNDTNAVKNTRKQEIEDIIYDGTPDLNELIGIQCEMTNFNFNKSDREYVNDMINENLDKIDTINQLLEIKSIMSDRNLNTDYVDKLLARKKPITINKINQMDKDDLEYIIYDEELTIEQWITTISRMKKFDFNKGDYETAYDYLNELLEEIEDEKKLNEIKLKMKDKSLNIHYVDKLISNINKEVSKEDENDESDNQLFDYLDKTIESLPMEVLSETKKQMINNNQDTEIIDKAINKEKRKAVELKKEKHKSIFWGVIGALFGGNNKRKMKIISLPGKKKIKNGNYEPINFEEEELEEDDYYYDDDKV